jgi:hypothetical protein
VDFQDRIPLFLLVKKMLFTSAWSEVISRVDGNGDPAGFYRMFILATAYR